MTASDRGLGPEVEDALALITRLSRTLGRDPSLVLHGGGNTSIKATGYDVTGDRVDVVLVKGSGWDLATIEPEGFAPLRRGRLLDLLELAELDDGSMVNELRQASLRAAAPTASIEALLHAHLPSRVVLHSHADAIVALTNRELAREVVADALGERVLVVPYVMPGFELARQVRALDLEGVDAIVLSNHGLFTFAEDGDAALERHLELVRRASHAVGHGRWGDPGAPVARGGEALDVARLRSDLAHHAGAPLLVRQSTSSRALEYARRDGVRERVSRGTATPEHVIYTKRTPLVGRDVAAYAADYERYVAEHRHRARSDIRPLDPAPRIVLDPELGLLTAASTPAKVAAVHDIALHTMDVVDAADRTGGYRSFDEPETFDVEYWELEQAKLGRRPRTLEGEVALVTGAASGIGRAVAARLLENGAAVVGVDLSPDVVDMFDADGWRGIVGDLSEKTVVSRAVETAVRDFGGIDMLIASAGIFPASSPIATLDDDVWDRALRVNATTFLRVLRESHPFLALAPRGGRVVLVSTKNVAAPGPGVAAYSASKAAAHQLARVAALEWARDRIRVNVVEPDAVFDTGIWTPELLAERAAHYGLTVDEYKTRNLLGVEVTSDTVAAAVLSFCEELPATTGARLTVDGGNDRVI